MRSRTVSRYSCDSLGNAALKSNITTAPLGALRLMTMALKSISRMFCSMLLPFRKPRWTDDTHLLSMGSHRSLAALAMILQSVLPMASGLVAEGRK